MERKSKRWIWIIGGIVVGGGLIVAILCAGLGSLAWLGWSELSEQYRVAMNRNPVILDHLGEVTEISIDLMATGDEPSDDVFVYRAIGRKGTGVVTAEFQTIDDYNEKIVSGTIELPDGQTFDLMPDG